MRTVVLGFPPELATWLDRRRATGADKHDEVWDGEYHMPPAPNAAHGRVDSQLAILLHPFAERAGLVATTIFNLGTNKDNFRVPDGGYHRQPPVGDWIPTAALVVEVVSPHDETWDKLDFYAAHGVEEILIADPAERSITWLELREGEYARVERSRLLGVTASDLRQQIDWPPSDDT
jgi:Uma2 family endonuclease